MCLSLDILKWRLLATTQWPALRCGLDTTSNSVYPRQYQDGETQVCGGGVGWEDGWHDVTVNQTVLFVTGGVQYITPIYHKQTFLSCFVRSSMHFQLGAGITADRTLKHSLSCVRVPVLVDILSLAESLSDYELCYQLLLSLYYERGEKSTKLWLTTH